MGGCGEKDGIARTLTERRTCAQDLFGVNQLPYLELRKPFMLGESRL